MPDSLNDLILSRVPGDGSSIGNEVMIAYLHETLPNLTANEYATARNRLINDGILGRARDGSIFRVMEQTDNNEVRAAASEGHVPQPRILGYRHDDERLNNPEAGMVRALTDPDGNKAAWIYDPHLDPILNFDGARAEIENLIDDALVSNNEEQMRDALKELKLLQTPYLNWTGKAEKTNFEINTVSLHVHERVDPATILASAAKRLDGEKATVEWRQPDLFATPFDNLPIHKALEFYKHPKGWSNRLVTGDSLLVMNSLLEKESMSGQVQMIYIDPPYGIKYGSNFQPFTNERDVKDRSDRDLTQEPETIKAFRDTWELGIHSYLTYLRDRLLLARELLTERGSVFVQISDENLHHVRELMDEVFGCRNHICTISYETTTGFSGKYLSSISDYIVWYGKDRDSTKFHQPYYGKEVGARGARRYRKIDSIVGLRNYPFDRRRLATSDQLTSQGAVVDSEQTFTFQDTDWTPPGGLHWKTTVQGLQRVARAHRVFIEGNSIRYARFLDDFPLVEITNHWSDIGGVQSRTDPKIYVVQTATTAIERCLLMTTDPGDLVFDPTCGSGTTAVVAEKWGRRWITCDTSRVAIALARQRLMTASFDYFALRYPNEGLKGKFDYETVAHVTLKSIADNSEIDTIHEEDHPKIEAALERLNSALIVAPPAAFHPTQGVRKGRPVSFRDGGILHEWEVPFDLPDDWPEAAHEPFDAFQTARRTMQRRMDRSISDHAEQEMLYDKPRIDKSRLRITGPFSVEAVPAPTVLSLDDTSSPHEADDTVARGGETARQARWRDELLKTGVRGKGGAMLRFAEFETLPGLKYIHASGSLSETGERIVVSFGPEHAALEQRQVELALDEAEDLRPKPKFILFCAFAFDPEAAKDIDKVNWPGMTVLKAQMNTDLLTGDLKKKRASNQSFWLMGQPDVELRRRDGMWEVEVNGFDYFDPRKGDLVSGGKNRIAMWSLDTDYDGRSLMPCQVFFPMADSKGGWNRLRKTIRAELDEDLLDKFHGTVSLPFDVGDHERIAVKIVDDRGIESLKIMQLED